MVESERMHFFWQASPAERPVDPAMQVDVDFLVRKSESLFI